jgi:hypothetical protein
MAGFGVDAQAVEDYLTNDIPDLSSLSDEEARVICAEQLWIDCIVRPVEGFTHWRRTDVPALQQPEGSFTPNLCVRLDYPPDELNANTSAPDPVNPDQRLWFDVD